MEHSNCLNCKTPVALKFCPNCGQKADTHRITLKHFVAHDLLHGVWHIDKGIWFTLKQAIGRPGKAALEYIEGQRISYYNVFYLCLLVIGFDALVLHFIHELYPAPKEFTAANNTGGHFVADYAKYLLLAIVPILSFNAWLVFRKLKLNLAEHFILGGMSLLLLLLTGTLMIVSTLLVLPFHSEDLSYGLLYLFMLLAILSPMRVYWNATGGFYKGSKRFGSIVLFGILVYVQLCGILYLILKSLSEDGIIRMHVRI